MPKNPLSSKFQAQTLVAKMNNPRKKLKKAKQKSNHLLHITLSRQKLKKTKRYQLKKTLIRIRPSNLSVRIRHSPNLKRKKIQIRKQNLLTMMKMNIIH